MTTISVPKVGMVVESRYGDIGGIELDRLPQRRGSKLSPSPCGKPTSLGALFGVSPRVAMRQAPASAFSTTDLDRV